MDFGTQLKNARESKDLTLQQVSRELKINLNVLKKIESSEANELPNPTSTKGFLKSYAQHIDLNPEPVIEDYLTKLEVKNKSVQETVLTDNVDSDPFFLSDFIQKKVLPVVFLICVLVLGVVAYKYLSGVEQIFTDNLIFQAKDANIKPAPVITSNEDIKKEKKIEETKSLLEANKDKDKETKALEKTNEINEKVKPQEILQAEVQLVIEPLAKTFAYYKDQKSKNAITLSLKPNEKKTLKFKEAEITFLDAGAVSLILNGKDIGSPGVFAERKTIKFPSLEGL